MGRCDILDGILVCLYCEMYDCNLCKFNDFCSIGIYDETMIYSEGG